MARGKTRSTRHRSRSRGRRGSVSHNIPLAPVVGLAGGLAIPALGALKMSAGKPMAERAQIILDQLGQGIYGYSVVNQKWYTGNMTRFWAPVIGGIAAHKIATYSGLNRVLARMKLGFTI